MSDDKALNVTMRAIDHLPIAEDTKAATGLVAMLVAAPFVMVAHPRRLARLLGGGSWWEDSDFPGGRR